MCLRKKARNLFLEAKRVAILQECPCAARINDQYALWLELLDPELAEHGNERLKHKLRDPDNALGVVNFALQFGIDLDLEEVGKNIDREIAKNGGMTPDAAVARFSLAFKEPTIEQVASYIERYQDELAEHLGYENIQFRLIDIFISQRLIRRANNTLERLVSYGISAEDEKKLRKIIDKELENDTIESFQDSYRSSGSIFDLIHLVNELEKNKLWDDLCVYAKELFEKTHALEHAEKLSMAFDNTRRTSDLLEFINANKEFLAQSSKLRYSYAWGLYHEGELSQSQAMLASLNEVAHGANYRALKVNLAIAKGDWASLHSYVELEYKERFSRSAHELISSAKLAFHIGSSYAKGFLTAAVEKAEDNADIYVAAYTIASNAGWENDSEVHLWLENATKLSCEDGPIYKLTAKELLDQQPEWHRRESDTWALLSQGKLPISLAAQALNQPLTKFTCLSALANLVEPDLRRRSIIPAFSGKRMPVQFDAKGKTVAFDISSLLTLSFLNVLDEALDFF